MQIKIFSEVFMKLFNELIKNFDKIREYLRVFTVYGFKQRDDFIHKSVRTYDNEKRRIQSYLYQYTLEKITPRGKSIYINFDYMNINTNPLFEGFKTKSFTKNDIMLHFILLDILNNNKLTINEIYDKLLIDYLNKFDNYRMIDIRTIRIKLNEYIGYGLMKSKKETKIIYSLNENALDTIPKKALENLFYAASFYQNSSLCGFLGNFILERYQKEQSFFSMNNYNFSNTVDELIVFDLIEAIKIKSKISLFHNNNSKKTVLPLKLIDNIEQGRRYILVFNYMVNQYMIYRLDKILKIEILKTKDLEFSKKLNIANAILSSTWGVSLNGMDQPKNFEKWDLILNLNETTQKHIIKKLKSGHKDSILQKVGTNSFHYSINLLDANEIIPWIRKFIGYITYIDSTNKFALNRFINDIKTLKEYYMEEKDASL
jgi:hypothetical protein